MAFPDAWMQELLAKSDLASVVSEYTRLTPKGGKLWGCCPFHREKTGSFNVDVNKQLYYCFGCHAGGSIVQFVMEMEKLTYAEAIKYLAKRAGMEMPQMENDERLREEQSRANRLKQACRDAAKYFFEQLRNTPIALQYLTKRGLSPAMITRFGLGYSPDTWSSLFDYMVEKGYTADELVAADLVRESKSGRYYDTFRNRVMFPIISEHGDVIGFGGRAMGNDEPKYLNTGKTLIFDKGYRLYALNLFKKSKMSDIIFVEGYMDVVGLHNVGIDNVVASLGTALTTNQSRLVKRYTKNVFVCYDGDSAGQNATLRAIDIFAADGMDVRVIVLKDNLDPDEYAKKYGRDAFLKLKDEAMQANAYKLENMAYKYDFGTADGRQNYAIEACRLVSTFQPVEQERYYEVIANKTGLSFETIKSQGDSFGNGAKNTPPKLRNNRDNMQQFAHNDREKLELLLASCAAKSKTAAEYIADHMEGLTLRKDVSSFIICVRDAYIKSATPDIVLVLSRVESAGDTTAIAAALNEAEITDPLSTAMDCVAKLKKLDLKEQLVMLSAQLDMHEISIEEYSHRYNEIMRKLKQI